MPAGGGALCSIADADKAEALPVLAQMSRLGFTLFATEGTAAALRQAGVSAIAVGKLGNVRPNVVDVIEEGRVALVVNTISNVQADELLDEVAATEGDSRRSFKDGYRIRLAAAQRRIPCCTSLDTAAALVDALTRHRAGEAIAVATVLAYRAGEVGAAR